MGRDARRLLIVDDNADARDMLKELLELRGYVVETARDGLDALEILQNSPLPELILVDLLMPLMSGWELIAEIRKRERLSKTRVLVVSAVPEREEMIPSDIPFLEKPIDARKLYQLVSETLNPKGLH